MFVWFNVFDVNVCEMFFDGFCGFISGENIFFWRIDVSSIGDEFICWDKKNYYIGDN